MQEPKYMAQEDWVTYDTKELGRVRMFRAMSEDSASYLAHKLTTFDQLLAACEYIRPHLREYCDFHHAHSGGCSVEMETARDLVCAAIKKAKEGQ